MTLLISDLGPVLHCGLKEPYKILKKKKKKSLSQIKFKEEWTSFSDFLYEQWLETKKS